jgi:CRP-like cAMP-binding protein
VAGEVIIQEGARSGALYFLKEGKVEVSRGGVGLAEIEEAGTVLGEISILLDRPHIAEVKAAGTVRMHVASDAEAFLREHPEVNLHIARSLAKKVYSMSCYLVDLKRQYEGEEGHLGMVHEVLDSLMNLK